MQKVRLNNGIEMPQLGFGVYQIGSIQCERCVSDALDVGYRSIDTAQVYGNEKAVGEAIRKSSVPRSEIFVTTKLYLPNGGTNLTALASIDKSLKSLNLEYIDLLLMHEPFEGYQAIYKGMEDAYSLGKVKAIGISNFNEKSYIDLMKSCAVVPAVNQIETHVFRQQAAMEDLMNQYGTRLESWAPFATGNNNFFSNHTLQTIAEKHSKTVAQVGLRYLIQRGLIVIPKSTHRDRMAENLNVFNFTLSDEDIEMVTSLEIGISQFSWY
jgi:2,5-diketo-D-gluconate reductase A